MGFPAAADRTAEPPRARSKPVAGSGRFLKLYHPRSRMNVLTIRGPPGKFRSASGVIYKYTSTKNVSEQLRAVPPCARRWLFRDRSLRGRIPVTLILMLLFGSGISIGDRAAFGSRLKRRTGPPGTSSKRTGSWCPYFALAVSFMPMMSESRRTRANEFEMRAVRVFIMPLSNSVASFL